MTDDLLRVRDPESARLMLSRINWSFCPRMTVQRSRVFDCRRYHWYPATFIPEIPYTLIEVLTQPGARVFDPFAGIGTTFYQALLLGRIPYAVEICMVAVDYMMNLLQLFEPRANLQTARKRLSDLLAEYNAGEDYISTVPSSVPLEELVPWFAPETLNEISYMVLQQPKLVGRPEASALSISLSATLKSACRQGRGWGCIADNVHPKDYQDSHKSAIDLVRRHADRLLLGVTRARAANPAYEGVYEQVRSDQAIFHEDARRCCSVPDDTMDIVITSPPYPNMSDYVNSQRLSYYLSGHGLLPNGTIPDFTEEIGARRRRRKPGSLDDYLNALRDCNKAISVKLKVGGYACLVMPVFETDNTNNLERTLVIQRVLADLEEHGLLRECEMERYLPIRRRQHNSNWSTLERERIVVFRKV
jgi:DNA modification methylase